MDFPELPDGTAEQLRMIRVMVREDPTCLDNEDCPYSDQLKDILRQLATETTTTPVEVPQQADSDLEQEISSLSRDLQEFREALSTEDVKELNTYFRLKTTLLEKLTALRERAENVKQVQEFKSITMDVLSDELDKDQRTRVLQRLKEHIST